MRTISQSSQFKRDPKREAKGPHRSALTSDFVKIFDALANDKPLPEKYRDHALTGDWKDHRDCHVKPNLVLIYRKPDEAMLQLVRLGSHRRLPVDIQQVARRKLRMLNSAAVLEDLRIPPANRLEALKGDRKGRYSIRINHQWRICFRWKESGADDVEIVDYH